MCTERWIPSDSESRRAIAVRATVQAGSFDSWMRPIAACNSVRRQFEPKLSCSQRNPCARAIEHCIIVLPMVLVGPCAFPGDVIAEKCHPAFAGCRDDLILAEGKRAGVS